MIFQTFLYGCVAAPSVHLRLAGNPRLQPVAIVIPRYIVQKFLNEMRPLRPRIHHTHVALQNIDELRQFIQTCLT